MLLQMIKLILDCEIDIQDHAISGWSFIYEIPIYVRTVRVVLISSLETYNIVI